MNIQKKHLAKSVLFGVVTLAFLPGCDLFKSEDKQTHESQDVSVGSDQVLLSIDGKPVLTVPEYEEQLDMARQSNQQVDMLLQMMPNAEKDFVFKGISTGKLMKAWAENKGIDQTHDFKKQRKQLHDAMDLQLYMKHFDEAHPVKVSDSDVKKFYEEKKDAIPGLMTSPGGVHMYYVRFDSKDKAEDFLKKAEDAKDFKEFKKEAEEKKLSVANDVVNQKSQYSDAIKHALEGVKKFPSAHMVKVGSNSYWVLYATEKTEAAYRDLKDPAVQQGLKKMIADEQKEKQLESLMEQLKKEMNVVENHQYFEDKENQKRAAMEAERKAHGSSEDGNDAVAQQLHDAPQSAVKV